MKNILFILLLLTLASACGVKENKFVVKNQEPEINTLIDQWHKDVASFNYDAYFDKMTSDAVFVGTDATEVWSKKEFMNFSKPFFEKKKTWNFKPIKRNIYKNKQLNIAWFDETLDTWMGVCRGSGVVVKQNNKWKIQHYVLSLAVPNKDMNAVIKLLNETSLPSK